MNTLRQELVEIDKLLSKINVSGDAVMLLAAARQRLNQLYMKIDKPKEENNSV